MNPLTGFIYKFGIMPSWLLMLVQFLFQFYVFHLQYAYLRRLVDNLSSSYEFIELRIVFTQQHIRVAPRNYTEKINSWRITE